ncbi:MAG: ExbD/TolR family protein [Verrucomicrobiales bacterium]
MRFTTRKRRQAPAVIIISLIDILIVLLIFLMVTTTFKQHPAVKLALPESRQAKEGTSQEPHVIVTIAKTEPFFFIDTTPVTLVKLQEELVKRAKQNPNIQMAIRADTDAPFGQIVKVMDAAKEAKIKASISTFIKNPGQ